MEIGKRTLYETAISILRLCGRRRRPIRLLTRAPSCTTKKPAKPSKPANPATTRQKATGAQKMDLDPSKRGAEVQLDQDRENARLCVGDKQFGGEGTSASAAQSEPQPQLEPRPQPHPRPQPSLLSARSDVIVRPRLDAPQPSAWGKGLPSHATLSSPSPPQPQPQEPQPTPSPPPHAPQPSSLLPSVGSSLESADRGLVGDILHRFVKDASSLLMAHPEDRRLNPLHTLASHAQGILESLSHPP